MQRSIRIAAWMILGAWTCVPSAPVRAEPPGQKTHSDKQEHQQTPRTQRQTPSQTEQHRSTDRDASPELDQLTDEELRALEERGELIFVKGERAASRPVAIGERAIGQRDLAVTPRRSAGQISMTSRTWLSRLAGLAATEANGSAGARVTSVTTATE